MRYVLPGFKRGLTVTLLWLFSLIVLPLVLLFVSAGQLQWTEIWRIAGSERVVSSILLSFRMAFVATVINLIFGFLLTWILVRYDFPGKNMVNALIDLPFALPTAVAGISLAALYAPNGPLGSMLAKAGIQIGYTPNGIAIALIFISLPFVVRSIQPVLEKLDTSYEEAAVILGASKWIILRRVIIPMLLPAMIGGAGMGFARSLGEYGSVIFIAGNVPLVSEIAPLIIMSKLELYDIQGASVVALLMILISFLIILIINALQWRLNKKIAPIR